MSKSKALQATEGDVFMIPVNDAAAYLGQVVGERGVSLYMVVFDQALPIGEITDSRNWRLDTEPLFALQTFDGLFDDGTWKVIGRASPDRERFLPAFTHGLPETGGVRVTDFSGNRERLATLEESNAVPHMITRSPLLLEKAVRAHAGLEPWLPAFDGIRYKKTPTSAELFGA
ncbi:immunity 26/phosphotriesterase HocA family protein [Curtobacterium herbarum]|uniref:immunity 26/phosphotriesterase HocA family protein n=1 Tax=Curtobacterium herbarum TaxID=150122 RepID=UPI001C8D6A49|nr:immunity 26/phosphotriesterase HocA family protein [Curtobacterium herbarum]MBY0177890.1 hypothetical protein [Curtobacterium herbarum]